MRPNCNCTKKSLLGSGARQENIKVGSYFRTSDQKKIQRYRCPFCNKTFSEATWSDCLNQKKRHMNKAVVHALMSGVSQRRAALILNLNRKSIVRKFRLMGQKSLKIIPLQNARSL